MDKFKKAFGYTLMEQIDTIFVLLGTCLIAYALIIIGDSDCERAIFLILSGAFLRNKI